MLRSKLKSTIDNIEMMTKSYDDISGDFKSTEESSQIPNSYRSNSKSIEEPPILSQITQKVKSAQLKRTSRNDLKNCTSNFQHRTSLAVTRSNPIDLLRSKNIIEVQQADGQSNEDDGERKKEEMCKMVNRDFFESLVNAKISKEKIYEKIVEGANKDDNMKRMLYLNKKFHQSDKAQMGIKDFHQIRNDTNAQG